MAMAMIANLSTVAQRAPRLPIDTSEVDRGAIQQEKAANSWRESLLYDIAVWDAATGTKFVPWVKGLPWNRPRPKRVLTMGDIVRLRVNDPLGGKPEVIEGLLAPCCSSRPIGVMCVSENTPLFAALVGRTIGDVVTWEAPNGLLSGKITGSRWLPRWLRAN